ncbi:MAG: hypothetical protein WBA42_18055 [Mesorhizobium sp.]
MRTIIINAALILVAVWLVGEGFERRPESGHSSGVVEVAQFWKAVSDSAASTKRIQP